MLGNSFVKAVQMANDDLKDTKYRYELVIRDSGPDPAKAKDVIRQVVNVDKVDAIVGGISLNGQVTKPYATAAEFRIYASARSAGSVTAPTTLRTFRRRRRKGRFGLERRSGAASSGLRS